MLYRPPSHAPKTAWARHLDQVMRDRDWSRVKLFEEVGAALGYGPKSRSAFLPLLIDKEPDEHQAAILAAHFGWPPESPTEPLGTTESGDGLAAALMALARELQASREERASFRQEMADLRALVDGLVEQALGASPKRSARDETTG